MKSQNIPRGAIYIPLPLIRQPDEYSCGAGSLMSIGCHWSVGPVRIQDYKTALGTNPINGTYHRDIVRYARELGLSARIQTDISRAQLQSIIARRIPVIIAFQAWAPDPVVYDDPNHNKDGHYAVCVGFDRKNNFYFMDPGLTGRYGVLSWRELDKRWHEHEDFEGAEAHQHLGIIVQPRKRRPLKTALSIV